MNIYMVSRTDEVAYDEYASAVIVAASESDARDLWPGPLEWRHYDSYADMYFSSYFMDPRSLKVELLGTAVAEESRIVLYKIRCA